MTYQPEWHPEHVNTIGTVEQLNAYEIRNRGSAIGVLLGSALSIIRDREREIAHLRAQLETERVRRWHATYNAAVPRAMCTVIGDAWNADDAFYPEVHAECSRVADAAHGPIAKGDQ